MHATAYPRDDARLTPGVGAPDDSGWVLGVLRHSVPGRVSVEYGSGRSVAYRCRRTSKLRRVADRGVSRNGGVVVVVHEELRVLAAARGRAGPPAAALRGGRRRARAEPDRA